MRLLLQIQPLTFLAFLKLLLFALQYAYRILNRDFKADFGLDILFFNLYYQAMINVQPVHVLAVSLSPIVRFAQHLAIIDGSGATLAPGRYMVGVHVRQLPDSRPVGIVTDGAVGTVRDSFLIGFRRLLRIDSFLRRIVKHTDIKQARFLTATQDILENTLLLLHEEVLV